eukprot:Awhi_evm1s13
MSVSTISDQELDLLNFLNHANSQLQSFEWEEEEDFEEESELEECDTDSESESESSKDVFAAFIICNFFEFCVKYGFLKETDNHDVYDKDSVIREIEDLIEFLNEINGKYARLSTGALEKALKRDKELLQQNLDNVQPQTSACFSRRISCPE